MVYVLVFCIRGGGRGGHRQVVTAGSMKGQADRGVIYVSALCDCSIYDIEN